MNTLIFNKRLMIAMVLLMAPLGGIGIDLYTPSLPAITRHFSVDASLVKLTLSIYLLGLGMGQFVFGFLSDSLGRRRLLLIGMLVYVVISLVMAMSTNIGTLLVFRLLQGLATGAPAVLYRSLIMRSEEHTSELQ